MKDVAARHAEGSLQVDRRADVQARLPVGVAGQAVKQWLRQVPLQSDQRRLRGTRPAAIRVLAEQIDRGVQPEQGQRGARMPVHD